MGSWELESLDPTRRVSKLPADVCQPRVSLLIYHGCGVEAVPLSRGRPQVVGRGAPSDVVIADPSLSRQHARFALEDDQVVVEDLGSTNGTTVKGEPTQRAALAPGAEVRLGQVVVVVNALTASVQGVESHERFLARLQEEVGRARFFNRGLALLMVSADDQGEQEEPGLHRCITSLQPLMRPVDRMALYQPDTLEILLPEASHKDALALARRIVGRPPGGTTTFHCGVASCPEAAGSAEKLLEVCRIALERTDGEQRVQSASESVDPDSWIPAAEPADPAAPLVASAAMRQVYETVERLAQTALPVLILGETGSGKELVARAIHERGPRRGKPMRCINCAAIPDQLIESALFGHEKGAFTGASQRASGVFEKADGGTVLLDEVGELAASAQAALLRVLETKTITRVGSCQEIAVDVRILAATHRDLEAMCHAGTFRWDLFFRLNTMTFHVPPLRDRPEEIEPLALHFLALARKEHGTAVAGIAPVAMDCLRAHHWPGNVRELRNEIARAAVIARGAAITPDDLSPRIQRDQPLRVATTGELDTVTLESAQLEPGPDDLTDLLEGGAQFKTLMRRYEVRLILAALTKTDWNQAAAARLLGMPARTFTNKMQAHNLRRPRAGG